MENGGACGKVTQIHGTCKINAAPNSEKLRTSFIIAQDCTTVRG